MIAKAIDAHESSQSLHYRIITLFNELRLESEKYTKEKFVTDFKANLL